MTYESKYRSFYVLGDSLSDTGALVGILSPLSYAESAKFDEPFYQGRSFSNGPVAVEYLAKCLNLQEFKPGWSYTLFSKKYEQKGQNYAVSYGTAFEYSYFPNRYFFNKFQLKNQLNALIEHNPNIGKEDLVLIMIGGNDVMLASTFQSDEAEKILEQAVSEICNAIKTLKEHNVQHIIVANAPDIGLIPAFNKNAEAKEFATKLTNTFNKKLADGLQDIEKMYKDLEIKRLDLYCKMKELVDEYKNKGLNYTDACVSDVADEIGDGYIKSLEIFFELIVAGKLEARYNPWCSKETLQNYLFFDYFHPTANIHQEVGSELCKLIR